MKTTTLSKFQAAMAAEVETDNDPLAPRYTTLAEVGEHVAARCTAETLLGDIVGHIRVIASQDGLTVSELEIRDEAQRIRDELRADPYENANPLDGLTPHPDGVSAPIPADDVRVADPFVGMALEIEPLEAYGMIQAKVRGWLDDRGIIAQEDEIRAKTNDLYGEAQSTAPVRDWRRPDPGVATEATYTVAPDGLVEGYEADPPKLVATQLPEMPPEAPGALKVPSDSVFAEGWADSTSLYQRAAILIGRHPDELEHLEGMSLGFLWKAKGGKSKGRPVMGQCVKAGGLVKHFSHSVFIIWLAADNVRAAGYRDREIEALLFRQLLAAGVAEVDEDTGRGGGATLVPPDVQVYEAELRVYGAWESALKSAAKAFQQVSLFSAPAVTYPDPIVIDNPLTGAGQLIHDDGTPLTDQEIADLEMAESEDL